MATYRIGIGSFNLKDGAVGLGTESSGLGNLKVEGTIRTSDLDVTGVSTFTRYAGFAADDLNINVDTSLTGEHSTQGDIVVGVNSTFTVSTGATVTVGAVESVSIGTHFSVPIGNIEERPEVPVEGTVRFNIDLYALEFYNGVEWREFTVNGSSNTNSGISIIYGGYSTANLSIIQSLNVKTLGEVNEFGNVLETKSNPSGGSNGIRAIFAGGYRAPLADLDEIDYVTFASKGNGVDFGNLTEERFSMPDHPGNSSTRACIGGGLTPSVSNVIDYIEISTLGNATDFGDLQTANSSSGGVSNPTRGIFCGGNVSPQVQSHMEYITISSKGNGVDFGELTHARRNPGSHSNTVRGVMGGGGYPVTYGHGSRSNVIDYITIASLGNATDFGTMENYASDDDGGGKESCGGVGDMTRIAWPGGLTASPSQYSLADVDYVEIMTTGNAMKWGDLPVAQRGHGDANQAHGGLGGY